MKKIKLNGKRGGYALVDDVDYDLLIQHKWHQNAQGYAVTRIYENKKDKKIHRMHRMIMQLPKTPNGLFIDHANGNKLDNRKKNLRPATHSENIANSKKRSYAGKPAKSKYKGVWFQSDKNYNRTKKWVAELKKNGVRYRLGHFLTEIEAAEAYNKKAKEIHKQFAPINKIL